MVLCDEARGSQCMTTGLNLGGPGYAQGPEPAPDSESATGSAGPSPGPTQLRAGIAGSTGGPAPAGAWTVDCGDSDWYMLYASGRTARLGPSA